MADGIIRLRQRLAGVSEQRVLAAGVLRLHEELVAKRSASVMELPLRANGTSHVLQASFFKRLLGGQLELKSCLETDVSGAQADLRHLTVEQLLAVRAATADFSTESASHSAHRNFLASVDVHLFEKLARLCVRGGPALPEKAAALHKLGFHMALMLGAAELLARGWGMQAPGGEGEAGDSPPAPECWLVKLDGAAWSNCHFALFHALELSVDVLVGKNPDVAASAAGKLVAVLNDQSVDVSKDRTLNWEVSLLDPRVEDVLTEAAILQRSPKRPSPPAQRSSSAPCAKRETPAATATWGAASAPTAAAGPRARREDLPRLSDARHGAGLRPVLQPIKTRALPCGAAGPREPPLPPAALAPQDSAAPPEAPEAPAAAEEAQAAAAVPPPQVPTAANEEAASGAEEQPEELCEAPPRGFSPGPAEVAFFLRAYGYPASDDGTWEASDFPEAHLKVSEHAETAGHTHYVLDCALFAHCGAGSPVLAWKASKRLRHLRQGLHDPVKQELGEEEYSRRFGNAPFARHMGLPGTTSRLRTWCQTLAGCMGAGLLRPALTAEVLRFLDVPPPAAAGAATATTPYAPVGDAAAAELGVTTAAKSGQASGRGKARARSVPFRKARTGKSGKD